MISFENVTKKYGEDNLAVDSISFTVRQDTFRPNRPERERKNDDAENDESLDSIDGRHYFHRWEKH